MRRRIPKRIMNYSLKEKKVNLRDSLLYSKRMNGPDKKHNLLCRDR